MRYTNEWHFRLYLPGLISISSGLIGCNKISAISGGNGWVDKPWKEVAQLCPSLASGSGWSKFSLPGKKLISFKAFACCSVETSVDTSVDPDFSSSLDDGVVICRTVDTFSFADPILDFANRVVVETHRWALKTRNSRYYM